MPRARSSRTRLPLSQRLTLELLREVAGPELLARSETLLAQDGVTVGPPSRQCVVGRVSESRTREHLVSLCVDPDSEGLLFDCDCDEYWQEGLCPHSVAVGLAWLQGPAPRRRVRTPKVSARPATPKALEAWLVEHQVTRARTVPVAVLEPLLPRSFDRFVLQELRKATVAKVLDGTATLRALTPRERSQIGDAAWTWTREEAERIRQGLAHEASATALPPPTDARLTPLRDALLRARERVRPHALPRQGARPPRITLQEAPARLRVSEPELAAWGRPRHPTEFEEPGHVVLDPRALMEGRPGLACSCSPKAAEAHCVHALTAVDAVLELLGRPKQATRAAKLAELLFEAPGREIVAALETTFLGRSLREASADTEPSLTFRLELEASRNWALKPFVHQQLTRGGWSKGTAVLPHESRKAAALLHDPEEQQAFALVQARQELALSYYSHESNAVAGAYALLLQALRALRHSTRLRLANAPDVPARVVEASLGFALEQEERALRLRPAVEGRPVDAEALQPPPSGPTAPQPWLLVEPGLPSVTLVSVPPEALGLLDTLKLHGTRVSERQ